MNEDQTGQLETTDDGYVISFERRYAHPVDEVWSAITQPERLRQWVGANQIELDLAPGGKLISRDEAGAIQMSDTVLRVEPQRLFEHTFAGSPTSVVCWELAAEGDGCLLRLTHTERTDTAGEQTTSFLAGWHNLLDALGEHMAGTQKPGTMERWTAYKSYYDERNG